MSNTDIGIIQSRLTYTELTDATVFLIAEEINPVNDFDVTATVDVSSLVGSPVPFNAAVVDYICQSTLTLSALATSGANSRVTLDGLIVSKASVKEGPSSSKTEDLNTLSRKGVMLTYRLEVPGSLDSDALPRTQAKITVSGYWS